MFRFAPSLCVFLLTVACLIPACTSKKNDEMKFPEKTPKQVVTQFFELLANRGRLNNQEAFTMVSKQYIELDQNNFRKWTENLNPDSKITVAKTILPTGPNKHGVWVATVKLNVSTPSMFGDSFSTTSKINVILDTQSNEWEIDFLGDTIDDADYQKMPAEAGLDLAESPDEK
ncbi:hypothetical protein MNBD_NITROSPINAE01-1125 [hydrothermal vent metagenome]|uniref:DUF3828 domain-containing protein n=1 Tax=hydrothermal vent metagenome TaxID=652676 RepID=A0A3B1C0D1_9ZZZZ